tara:strand:- start:1428 stop:3212 length:1785 start_codon:yes stop_codon:yes gene_type:complete
MSIYGNDSPELEDYKTALQRTSFVGQDRGLANKAQTESDIIARDLFERVAGSVSSAKDNFEGAISGLRMFQGNSNPISSAINQAEINRFQNQYQTGDFNPSGDMPAYKFKDKPVSNTLTGGAGGVRSAANKFALPKDLTDTLNELYAGLETTAQEQLGGLETEDFSDEISDLIDSGRLNAEQLTQLQQEQLVDAEGRALDKIGQVEAEVMAKLQDQEADRNRIMQSLADESALRTGDFRDASSDRLLAARENLGPMVTSEFEEVAGLTGALTEAQAASDAASSIRLRQVANMAAAERLAAPAQLAAEAQMAVGDEKFRMEGQLRLQLAQNMAQLDTSEREMLLQEAMRQEQFGIGRDQALANAMFNISQQRNQALFQEQIRLDTVQQRQSEILQQQGFQERMAAQSRAASAAASAANKQEMEAAKESAFGFLYDSMANNPNSVFSGMSQEEFDALDDGFKMAQYEALVGYSVESQFSPSEAPETMGFNDTWFAQNYGTGAAGLDASRVYRSIGEKVITGLAEEGWDELDEKQKTARATELANAGALNYGYRPEVISGVMASEGQDDQTRGDITGMINRIVGMSEQDLINEFVAR